MTGCNEDLDSTGNPSLFKTWVYLLWYCIYFDKKIEEKFITLKLKKAFYR
jgi:hypothetical protein